MLHTIEQKKKKNKENKNLKKHILNLPFRFNCVTTMVWKDDIIFVEFVSYANEFSTRWIKILRKLFHSTSVVCRFDILCQII